MTNSLCQTLLSSEDLTYFKGKRFVLRKKDGEKLSVSTQKSFYTNYVSTYFALKPQEAKTVYMSRSAKCF